MFLHIGAAFCKCGFVLNLDSAIDVENGSTLHLVERQPTSQPSSSSNNGNTSTNNTGSVGNSSCWAFFICEFQMLYKNITIFLCL